MHQERRGALLVFGSAAVWSFGGAIARFLETSDSWVTVFWRSVFAAAFLLGFMLYRDGPATTRKLFIAMGLPGVGVALCFATASTCFVVALSYTTVANVLLMQAGVPLIAALLGFVLFRERVSLATWAAIATVIAGVAIMVSASLGGAVSPIGDGLALLVAVVFACATVITRRHSDVAMMPAVCLGTLIAAGVSGGLVGHFAVSGADLGLLFLFGAANLGLGMALFVTGARLLPAALAALIGTAEPVLGPIWVWLIHGELPGARTLLGGSVVFLALLAHLAWQFHQQGRAADNTLPPGAA
ncbi:EamA family transporter [Rhodoferax lacus]|uniref:EamA family transporter n=1 Tax=Rhodoferax lacus TaxID=2184758 RepID=A0A3E1RFZ7_9BURK|nr:DMT family transporter [Rhodoferax lacus]RFO98183.1 EamA family transporter [Rhodoferax lacus]